MSTQVCLVEIMCACVLRACETYGVRVYGSVTLLDGEVNHDVMGAHVAWMDESFLFFAMHVAALHTYPLHAHPDLLEQRNTIVMSHLHCQRECRHAVLWR